MIKKSPDELRVAVLGAGPSAAFGVAALKDLGVGTIHVLTTRINKPPKGAFWFHDLPPSVRKRFSPTPIAVFGVGTEQQYLWNQYGRQLNIKSSFPSKLHQQHGYDPFAVWDVLWEGIKIVKGKFFSGDDQIRNFAKDYDLVFHTFPSAASILRQSAILRYPVVVYDREPIYFPACLAMEDWQWYQRKACSFLPDTEHNLCVYNGTSYLPWVRVTRRWGAIYIELPATFEMLKNLEYIWANALHPETCAWVQKIEQNIYPLGRFAQWDRKTLSHHSYSRVHGICSKHIMSGFGSE